MGDVQQPALACVRSGKPRMARTSALPLKPLTCRYACRGRWYGDGSAAAPCAHGWIRRDALEADEVELLSVALGWLASPAWASSGLWWVAESDDVRRLAALNALGWTREPSTPSARAWARASAAGA